MKNLAILEEVKDFRSIWQHEASDFTPWLSKNINILADAVGFEIEVEETESSVGNFSADIFALETGTDRKIIIENQLEWTDHDHLGKLITYASGKSANIIIWIVKQAREEHRAAIEWLNNHTDEKIGFFLCEIKLYKIGDSAPAVKFEVVEKPNEWTREARITDSITHRQRYDYWNAFEDYAFKNSSFSHEFRRRKPSSNHWMDFSIGSSACHLCVSQVRKDEKLTVELYIGDDKELYQSLFKNKDSIEHETGFKFDWREMLDKKSSRILIAHSAKLEDQTEWNKQFDWLIDVMVKMKAGFKKYI